MQPSSDWWSRCSFICDYFFGRQRKIAHQLAEHLAKYYVGDGVSELRPDTDVSALIADSFRRYIDKDDFTMVRQNDMLAAIDLTRSIKFKDLVQLVCVQRGLSA
jgi:hypothetical protein